jgi:hypothetical protein
MFIALKQKTIPFVFTDNGNKSEAPKITMETTLDLLEKEGWTLIGGFTELKALMDAQELDISDDY